MNLNKFEMMVSPGLETPDGYVAMQHGQQYEIVLNNLWNQRCDAKVSVDGQEIGTFRLNAFESMRLERTPGADSGKLTFYAAGTIEAQQVGIARGNETNGLIQATFWPEQEMPRPIVKTTYPNWHGAVVSGGTWSMDAERGSGKSFDFPAQSRSMNFSPSSFGEGASGLSGHSNQSFISVGSINRDYSQETTISLRLVVGRDEPRPLRATKKYNPVPGSVR